ncbi:hypothetical protein AMK12_27395 [Streptomyces sp. TSRI0395]|nr:hypothetical protein AMK12_27395 [Streptomyces sp. TSRI0395]
MVGIVECKRDGTDLTDAMDQASALAEPSAGSLPWPVWRSPLPYRYVSDGRRLLFCDAYDPEPHARLSAASTSPARWPAGSARRRRTARRPTYRARQAAYLPRQDEGFDQSCNAQHGALRAIEQALAAGQRCALVHMATGSGRSLTGLFTAYRQLRYARGQGPVCGRPKAGRAPTDR